jgi:hypothetical protein
MVVADPCHGAGLFFNRSVGQMLATPSHALAKQGSNITEGWRTGMPASREPNI